MADEMRVGLLELLRKAQIEGDPDFLREGVRVLSQALMEMEVEQQHLGAAHHERSAERTGYRNGYRKREWDTRAGTIELKVPRVLGTQATSLRFWSRVGEQRGHFLRWCRKRMSTGSSTRKVDELVKALGMSGISKSRVSELALRAELDEEVERF